MSKLQIGAHRAPIHESAFIRVYLRLENSIQVFVADFCVVPTWPYGYCYWSVDGGGMMCSASQDWKLSLTSTTLSSPLAIT